MRDAGCKPDKELPNPRAIRLINRQARAFQDIGGSPWLQDLLNLKLRRQNAEVKTNALTSSSRHPRSR
jgi:hypothetical protein